jgi:hypothetical protein
MRMWCCDPRILCNKHLGGEYAEFYKHRNKFEKQHNIDGYIKNNCIEPKSMQKRHDELVIERRKRGLVAKGTFVAPDISYLPEHIQNYKIDIQKNLKLLIERCPECRKRYEELIKCGII